MFARRVGSPLGVAITQEITRSLFGRQTAAERIRELLFSAGQQGVMYVPKPTVDGQQVLYQDSAGTTPVTADGQPVGLMLDLHKGLVRGPELVTNGTFDTDTDWTLAAGATISGGVLSASGVAANTTFASQAESPPMTAGSFYEVRFTVSNYTSGGFFVFLFGGGNVSSPNTSVNGEHTAIIQASAAHTTISLRTGATGLTADVDNISVRELPGNHATQSTSAARMVLSGGQYLLSDKVDDNFDVALGANFTGDFALILDTGPIFGAIDTKTDTVWRYTKNAAYIPDGKIHALIVRDAAFSAAEKQAIIDTYAAGITTVPTTALQAFRDRTDLTALDTSYGDWTQVTDAVRAFFDCSSLTTPPDVSGWTQVTSAFFAFYNCSSLTTPPDVSGWTQVTNAGHSFRGCSSLTTPPDVSGWTQVTDASYAFLNCSNLTTPVNITNWNPLILTDGALMMSGISAAGFDQASYDAALIAWDTARDLTLANALSIHFGSAKYTAGGAAEAARTQLVNAGWTITDGGAAV